MGKINNYSKLKKAQDVKGSEKYTRSHKKELCLITSLLRFRKCNLIINVFDIMLPKNYLNTSSLFYCVAKVTQITKPFK